MNRADETRRRAGRPGERGGSRLSFVLVLLAVAAASYVLYQFVPVMYNASLYRVYMQDTVNKAAVTGQTVEWVKTQLRDGGKEYQVPPDALIEAQNRDKRIEARVSWTRHVRLPGYVYQYSFDHTVTSSTFFIQQ